MKKLFLALSFIITNVFFSHAQPNIQWQKSYGGSAYDATTCIQQTLDGGYIIAGYSDSNDSELTLNNGYFDYWIVKINNTGDIQWQKSLGGSNLDEAYSIQQTKDSGYIVAGYSLSQDSDITGHHGPFNYDYWVVKLDSAGTILWERSLGGTLDDKAYSIQQTFDGGYIIAGYSDSNDSDVTGNHGGFNDYWIVKIDSSDSLIWQKSLGGTSSEEAFSIKQTSDSGYIVAGFTLSGDSDVTYNNGGEDYWIVKLDTGGTIQWQKSFGGSFNEEAYSISQTKDGGYIVAGISNSDDGDVSGNNGDNDDWIVKLDQAGNLQWQKSLGGSGVDIANCIQQTFDGGYIVAGYSNSNDSDVSGHHGTLFNDCWIVKLDSAGNLQWQNSYGGTEDEAANFILQTPDSGYIFAGFSKSNDGDASGNNGDYDFWIVKLSDTVHVIHVNTEEIKNQFVDFNINPNPFSTETKISFSLPSAIKIKIEIRDLEGRVVRNLDSENSISGENNINWDATDDDGNKVCDGVYFVSVVSDNICVSKKVIVIKN